MAPGLSQAFRFVEPAACSFGFCASDFQSEPSRQNPAANMISLKDLQHPNVCHLETWHVMICRQEPGLSIPHRLTGCAESQPEASSSNRHSGHAQSASGGASSQQPGRHHQQPALRRASYTGIDLAAKASGVMEEEEEMAGAHTEDEEEFAEAAKRIGTDLDRQLMGAPDVPAGVRLAALAGTGSTQLYCFPYVLGICALLKRDESVPCLREVRRYMSDCPESHQVSRGGSDCQVISGLITIAMTTWNFK